MCVCRRWGSCPGTSTYTGMELYLKRNEHVLTGHSLSSSCVAPFLTIVTVFMAAPSTYLQSLPQPTFSWHWCLPLLLPWQKYFSSCLFGRLVSSHGSALSKHPPLASPSKWHPPITFNHIYNFLSYHPFAFSPSHFSSLEC